MGKFMRKCKGKCVGEIAVMEVSHHQVSGVITRARMRTLAMGEAKRKRDDHTDLRVQDNCRSKVRRKILRSPEKLNSPATNSGCSSSNGSENRSVVDLEDIHTFENSSYRERREITTSSESNNMESTTKTEEEDSLHKSVPVKMPTELELEEFFTEAESAVKKRFADKYNFDIEKDVPLEGRYEWMAMKI